MPDASRAGRRVLVQPLVRRPDPPGHGAAPADPLNGAVGGAAGVPRVHLGAEDPHLPPEEPRPHLAQGEYQVGTNVDSSWKLIYLILRTDPYLDFRISQRQTPRHVLLLAAGGAVLQLALEHLILPAFLPPTRLLTHTVSLFAFCFANLITSVVLIARPKGREAYKTHSLGERTPASIGSTTDPQGVLRDIGDDKLP